MEEKRELSSIEQIQNRLANTEASVNRRKPKTVKVLGKDFIIRDLPRVCIEGIINIGLLLDEEVNKDNGNEKRQKVQFINTLDVQCAALILIWSGKFWWFNCIKSWFYGIYWRYLRLRYSTERFSGIIEQALNNEEEVFFLKNYRLVATVTQSRKMMMKIAP